jgi:hypothetical protein
VLGGEQLVVGKVGVIDMAAVLWQGTTQASHLV